MASYSQQAKPEVVLTLDLTNARDRVELVKPGLAVQQVYIASLPAGADCRLRFGANNPPVPMVQTGGKIMFEPLLDGLYLDNTAQAGLTAIIALVFGSKR